MIHDCVFMLPQKGAGDTAQDEHTEGLAGGGEGVTGVGAAGGVDAPAVLSFTMRGSRPILRWR